MLYAYMLSRAKNRIISVIVYRNETLLCKLKKILSDYLAITCWKCPPFAATQERIHRRHCLTTLSITHWWVPATFPFLSDTLLQLLHIFGG